MLESRVVTLPPQPAEMPFLVAISWFDATPLHLPPEQMLARYERGWRHLGVIAELGDEERRYVRALALAYGSFLDVPA